MDRDNENWASAERVGDEIAVLATNIDAATHRLLTCIRRFDESEEWGRQGALSCAHWLSWRIGLDAATSREKVPVARLLNMALYSTGALLERICRKFRRVVADMLPCDPTPDERRTVTDRVLPS